MEKQGMQILEELFENLFGINMIGRSEEYYQANLYSAQIGLTPRDIIYLLKEIEEQYAIRFSRQDLLGEGFFSIVKLACYLENYLGQEATSA